MKTEVNMKEFLKNFPWKRLVWAIWLPVYIATYLLLEHIFSSNDSVKWITDTVIDSWIPFYEGFIIAYLSWFLYIVGTGFYLLINNEPAFKRYMIFLAVTFFSCALFWVIVPNGQGLRPEVYPRDNLCTDLVKWIHSIDTPTNVFPSEHIIGTCGALIGLWDAGLLKKQPERFLFILWGILIAASTVCLKQHAFIDILGGVGLSAVAGFFVYKRRIFPGKVA